MTLNVTTKNYKYGLITSLEPESLKRGAASASLNWLTEGDRIVLRGGQKYLGVSSLNEGTGAVTGLKRVTNALGVELLFGTYGKKLKYYTTTAAEWAETGTDLLGSAVVDSTGLGTEAIFMSEYVSPAGNQMWVNSPNCAGFFKIMVANPADSTDLYDASKNFKGDIKIDTNRTLLWGRIADKTGVYGSYIDAQGYTTVSAEDGWTGDGSKVSFSRGLDFKPKATSTLTSDATNVADADTVTVGTTVYRFKDTMTQAYDVKRGADAATSLANLKKAINAAGVAGTNYFAGTLEHPTAEAKTLTVTTLVIQAKTAGTAGNSIATTETSGHLSFGGLTMASGSVNTRTCFAIAVTAGALTFTDNYAGTLTGSDGTSTGTINYTTGAITLTFTSAPAAALAITISYQYEATNTNGISDFTKSSPRTAGQGFVFRQDEGGGEIKNISTYASIYYCMHVKKTWALDIGATDTSATNLPFRDRVGIPNERASIETGDGIYYIDDQNPDDVKVRLLSYDRAGSSQVIPVPVSNNLNINTYRFDQAAAWEWGTYVLFACRQTSSPVNDRVLLYNKLWKAWDVLDYCVSCFETFEGKLVAGDSLSNNFIELFSGNDDFDSDSLDNYWIGGLDDLDLEGLKKSKKFYLRGLIGAEQEIDIYLAIDNGDFTLVGTIAGSGDYIDKTQAVTIGSTIMGSHIIGGGSDGDIAYNYERLFSLGLDKFERVQVKYVATKLGYASVSQQDYWDVRRKGKRVPAKYRG